ncbi:MAG: phosphatidylglycerol lysyltransferase domain-containing protein, partial [Peptostreptococcaceae bacterium]
IRGLYQYINQQFLVNEFPDVEFVNREEDLGIEGLRKAKLSYHPIKFVEKYTVISR